MILITTAIVVIVKIVVAGELYESVLTLYPLMDEHSNTTFRCYLVISLKAVDSSLFASYDITSVGPPPFEKPRESDSRSRTRPFTYPPVTHSHLAQPSRQLRSSSDTRLLRIPSFRLKSLGQRKFSF